MCFRCLDVGHNGCDCTRSRPCGLDGCTKLHHRFLHATQSRGPVFSSVTRPSTQAPAANSVSGRRAGCAMPNTASTQQSSSQTEQQTFCSVVTEGSPSTEEECYASQSTHVTISLRTIPVTIKHGDTSIHVNALLDDGSTMSYISEGVAHELGLHGELQSITVNTLDGTPSTFQSVHVSCSVASVNGMFSTDLHAWTVRHPTGRLKPVHWHRGASTWPHLKGIRFPPTAKPDRVDVLLGLDCVAAHQSLHEVTGKPGEPVARLTPLGWTILGPVRASPGSSRMGHAYHAQLQLGGNEISQLLRRFWDVEELAVPVQRRSISCGPSVEDNTTGPARQLRHGTQTTDWHRAEAAPNGRSGYQVQRHHPRVLGKGLYPPCAEGGTTTTQHLVPASLSGGPSGQADNESEDCV